MRITSSANREDQTRHRPGGGGEKMGGKGYKRKGSSDCRVKSGLGMFTA